MARMHDRWSHVNRRARWLSAGVVTFLFTAVFFYFVPGLPFSPHGTRTHQLGPSLSEAAVVTVVAGIMIRWVLPRLPL